MTPAWHDDAKRLYAHGVTVWRISLMLGKQWALVAFAVDHKNAREQHRRRCLKRRIAKGYKPRMRKIVIKPSPAEKLGVRPGRVVERSVYMVGDGATRVNRIVLAACWGA